MDSCFYNSGTSSEKFCGSRQKIIGQSVRNVFLVIFIKWRQGRSEKGVCKHAKGNLRKWFIWLSLFYQQGFWFGRNSVWRQLFHPLFKREVLTDQHLKVWSQSLAVTNFLFGTVSLKGFLFCAAEDGILKRFQLISKISFQRRI